MTPAASSTAMSIPELTAAHPAWTEEVLAKIDELEMASIELVAWELSLPPEVVKPAWSAAVDRGELAPFEVCRETGELLCVRRPQGGPGGSATALVEAAAA